MYKKVLHIKSAGFTLVEMLVSLAIFSVVIVAAIGSLYSINQASQRVNAMRTVLDNLDFATESMSRTIRTSSDIVCGGPAAGVGGVNCPFGGDPATEFSLQSNLGTAAGTTEQLDYRWRENGTNGEIQKCDVDTSGAVDNCVAITAPEINVTKASFFVNGADPADGMQPSVMMFIQGEANAGCQNSSTSSAGCEDVEPFAIQTMISQRAAE